MFALQHLSRVVSGGRRFIPEIDGLRFVAIVVVVLFHLNGFTLTRLMDGASVHPWEAWLPHQLGHGHFGVHFFFVLSGFLLSLPFAKGRLGLSPAPSLKTYFLRRLTRLEPPYVVSLLLLFGIGLVVTPATWAPRWPNLLASLAYQHNLVYGQWSLISPVAWSLEIEVQFYALAPVLGTVFRIRHTAARRLILAALAAGAIGLRAVLPPTVREAVMWSLPGYLEFFLAGFLLADVYLVDWKEKPPRTRAWDAASVLGWTLVLVAENLDSATDWLLPPALLLAYLGAFAGRASSWAFSRPWITALGGMCYSTYLLHYSVISLVGRAVQHGGFGASFTARFLTVAVAALPAVLAVATVYFVLLERPCMDPSWPSRLARWLRRGFAPSPE